MTPSPNHCATGRLLLTLGAASCFQFPASAHAQAPRLTVEYLANEGVLLSSGSSQVLIDGLFGDGLDGYQVVRQPVRDSLEHGLGRFAEIDLVLVSQVHRDHFNAMSLARHLTANLRARVAGSTQVRDSLRLLASWTDSARTTAIRPDPALPVRLRVGDITVEAHGISHPPSRNEPVEHLVWVVTVGGVRVMHGGDASPTPTELRYAAGSGVDLLLAPAWILGGARGAERIAATRAFQVAAMHLGEADTSLPPDRAVQLLRPGQRLDVP
jgi:L-ascorbate metabolism protein UlaG (beta-lactamase superfamily)